MSDQKPSHTSLAKALLAAQIDMPPIEPDSTNPHFKSRFVSLGHLLAKARPVLNRHGIAVAQFPARAEDGSPTLLTTLIHESGEKIQAEAPLLLSKQDPQGQGSAITYMRRYALGAALGISDQEDDDGASASKRETSAPSAAQLDQIGRLLKQRGADVNELATVRAYGAAKLTGGKGGSASKTIDALQDDGQGGGVAARMVAKALEWQAEQPDAPADTAGLPADQAA